MAKDPAFLFYPGDWLGGTMTFTRHQKGCYIDLLMAQFNEFDRGHLSLEDIKLILGTDYSLWDSKLKPKFKVDAEGKFYNQKLEDEIIRRRKFSQSRTNNLKGCHMEKHMESHMAEHMENENENETLIETKNENRKGVRGKPKTAKQVFIPPLHEEVRAYMGMRGLTGAELDKQTQLFMNHYTNADWKMKGGKKIKSWELTANSWMLRIKDFTPATNGRHEKQDDPTRSLSGLGSAISQYLRTDKPN